MKTKISLLLLFVASILVVNGKSAQAGYDFVIDRLDCRIDNDTEKYIDIAFNGNTMAYIKKQTTIAESITVPSGPNKGTVLKLDTDQLKSTCRVVYGTPLDVPGNTYRTVKGYKACQWKKNSTTCLPLYLGYTGQNGSDKNSVKVYPNSSYPELIAEEKALANIKWIREPWNNSDVMNSKSSFIQAVKPTEKPNVSDKKRLKLLSTAVDKYAPNKDKGLGYFATKNKNNETWILFDPVKNKNCDGLSCYSEQEVKLTYYANVYQQQVDYYPGFFNMFNYDSAGKLHYATFYFPPLNPWQIPNEEYDHALVCNSILPSVDAVEGKEAIINFKVNTTALNGSPAKSWINDGRTGVYPAELGLYVSPSNKNNPNIAGPLTIPSGVSVAYRWESTGDRKSEQGYYSAWIPMKTGTNTLKLQTGELKIGSSTVANKKLVYPKPNADGYATLIVNVNYNLDHYYYPTLYGKPGSEKDVVNNRCAVLVKIKETQDVKLELDGSKDINNPTKVTANTPLNGVTYAITNSMKKNINIPCTAAECQDAAHTKFEMIIKDLKTGLVVATPKAYVLKPTGDLSSWVIDTGKTLGPVPLNQLTLPVGKYSITINIPWYKDEAGYVNNTDTIYVESELSMPPNTKCDKYMKQGTSMTDTITKMCYGYYPNHPSNWTEGGIGTFFAIKYYFLPVPLPNYTITKGGTVDQTLTVTEKSTDMGSCKVGGTTNCDDLTTFFYFPTVAKCPADPLKPWCVPTLTGDYNPKGLKGPLVAGPHGFSHYMYRGRMLADSVNFTFTVYDVTGNHAIATNVTKGDPTGVGNFIYNVPNGITKTADPKAYVSRDSLPTTSGNPANDLKAAMPAGYTYTDAKDCFRTDQIDYTDSCRSIIFYLPNASVDMFSPPKESDKVQFLNVGDHTFELEATENQKYYYQHDDGDEYQGNFAEPSTIPSSWANPHKTPSITGDVYTSQEKIANHCENLTDGFGASLPGQPTCFHDHDAAYHYWKFAWSKVFRYDKDFKATW